MRNAATLSLLLAGCSSETQAPDSNAVQDDGLNTASEAVDIVTRWQKEGFNKSLVGIFEPESATAIIGDSEKCGSTQESYPNAVAINMMTPVSGDLGNGLHIEVAQAVHPSLLTAKITPMRVCDENDITVFMDHQSFVRNSGDQAATYSTLSAYYNTLARLSAEASVE